MHTSFSFLWAPFNELTIFATVDVTAATSIVLLKATVLIICGKFFDTSATFWKVIFT